MASYSVLIVANQKKDRQALRAGIATLGEELHILDASSGEEALLLLSRQPLDLLVTEFHLAGISGQELIQKVRQRHPALKAMLITSERDKTTTQEQATAGGAQAFFLKPVDMAVFRKASAR